MSINSDKNGLLPSNKKRLLERSASSEALGDPVKRYNHVIRCYNTFENQIDGIQLREMKEWDWYSSAWRILSKPTYLCGVLALIIVPVLGFIVYIGVVAYLACYVTNFRIYQENHKEVPNIFKFMVY